jgi:hypothetical protein
VIGGQSLYFLDHEEGDDEGIASIFATALDASAPVPVARHLKSPRLLGFLDGSLYFDDASSLRALFRTRSDSSIEKVVMPYYAALSIVVERYLARSIRDLANDTWEDEILELAP